MKFSYSLIKKILPKAPAKMKLVDGLNLHSFETENLPGDVFEISLSPNRYSDPASHIGIAREVGAVFGLTGKSGFKNPVKALINPPSDKGFIKIDVREPKLCSRYAARYFELRGGIKDSPKWMKDALIACGLKPINNVVDIMNYVMLETGQPLHVFDADRLATSDKRHGTRVIIVRRAKSGEKIKTLDGQKFALDKGILIVADKEKPLAIAGIKGGADSGVTEKTRRIIIEAANFDPVSVYKASRKFNLRTDASLRFGHGISTVLVEWGLDRATEFLLKEKAWLLDSVDYYPRVAKGEVVEFDHEKYQSIVGAAIDAKKAQKYFELLGFSIKKPPAKNAKNSFLVEIPSWRMDIASQEDLFEEVARLDGYDKLKPRAPLVNAIPAYQEDGVSLKEKVRHILVGLQLDEVYNSSFVGGASSSGHRADSNREDLHLSALGLYLPALVEVENPIAEDKKYLRPSLISILLKNTEENGRFLDAVRIFETGKVFSLSSNHNRSAVVERLSLGIVLAAKKDERMILEMKGLADELLRGLGVDDFSIVEANGTLRVEVGHSVLGVIGHAVLDNGFIAAFGEFDLDKILNFTEEAKEYVPIKRFPAVLRDISVLVSPDISIGDIVQEIQLANPKIIENVDLVDEYVNEKLGGRQSLTFRIIFQSEERTLTDDEVNKEMEKISAVLKSKFRAEIR